MTAGKRAFDLSCSIVGLAMLWPLFAAVALLIKAHDGGAVFFRQVRVGHRGRLFRVWKFRTMRESARLEGLPITVERDARITKVGVWLRRLKLDEVPQLFSVVSGHMSMVGPRPEVPKYVAAYTPEQREVLQLMPGITDPASLRYHDESAMLRGAQDPEQVYVEDILPAKIQMSLDYAARATRLSDIRVILATLNRLLRVARAQAPDTTWGGEVHPADGGRESSRMSGVAK